MAAGLEVAASNIEAWLHAQRLVLVRTNAPIIETYQVLIPVRPAHPLLTLQPPPNNPDVPTQKMWALKRSPYSNSGPRQALVDALNRGLPERDQKGAEARERTFKLRWALFAEPATFAHIQAVLNDVITRVRKESRA